MEPEMTWRLSGPFQCGGREGRERPVRNVRQEKGRTKARATHGKAEEGVTYVNEDGVGAHDEGPGGDGLGVGEVLGRKKRRGGGVRVSEG